MLTTETAGVGPSLMTEWSAISSPPMHARISHGLAILAALAGSGLLTAGAWSCIVGLKGNLGPLALTHETQLGVYDGVVQVPQITGYESAVSLSEWRDINPAVHPERITPRAPGFPWFGFSSDRQIGIAVPSPGAHVDSVQRGGPHRIIPANIRIFYFPIWLPAIALLIPWFAGVWSRRRGQIAALASRGAKMPRETLSRAV